ncbi:unnamed protein product [Adineta steineri]|uniref:NAD(+)--protein-arginine ADP-ribosyltransferase n=1 Tax=Adineta steineri TaxID=433720 RepID=A0A818YS38_9BILA|nr:unnamed protein product [Adineta steineri]CAF3753928.1 unnamed protein product [Adineta steineri]
MAARFLRDFELQHARRILDELASSQEMRKPIENFDINQTIYRGVEMDLSAQYPQGQIFTWWGFSSCTNSVQVLQSEQFLGKTGDRTLFSIDCESGKNI